MSQLLRILVLEDSAVEAELSLRELRRAGFEPQWRRVETEADFLAALDPPPDLILADYALPHFDGFRALKQLRARRPDIPFILISGKLGEEAVVEVMKEGATDFVLKDRLDRLGPAVERALAEQRLRIEKRQAEESLRQANARLQAANEELRAARVAALNLMEDALLARLQAEQAGAALQQSRDLLEQRVQARTQELNWANAALRGEKVFSDSLIELAPALIAVLDGQGNLIRTNAYAEQISGYLFAETQGRDMVKMFVPQPERPRVRRLLREALQGRAAPHVVAPLRTRDGVIRHIEWLSKPIANAAGELSAVLAIGHDITERLQADEALRRSEHHLANFFNEAPIGLIWLSAGGTILRANQAQMDLLGCLAAEYLGHSFLEFCVEESQGRELLKRLAARETVRNLRMSRRRKDGTIRHVLVDANASWHGNKFEYSSVFVRDITDRIILEEEILHISEQEQRRIAQDLHDGLGQLLAGAAYLAGTARQDLAAKSPLEARKLRRIWEVINEALAMTRNLARGLHPVEAEPNGLMVALENLAVRTQKLFQIRCHFNCRRPVLVPDARVATHLFRIVQEAITNAIKHGHPGRIEIGLTATRSHLMLAVKDDGSGMPARQRKQAGMGLRIMRYRAGMIGGSLAIQKESGGGTTVACTVHLPDPTGPTREPKTTVAAEARRRTGQTTKANT